MNGPEHYRSAQDALQKASSEMPEARTYWLQRAHVHATLALAAATAMDALSVDGLPSADSREWREIAGVRVL